jgi:predicted TIM-barrel fold metal-dependent hydrolase
MMEDSRRSMAGTGALTPPAHGSIAPAGGPATMVESILEPNLPIIDPHHHLWDLTALLGTIPEPKPPFVATVARTPYYVFDQLRRDLQSGHRVIGTVFMECGAFYRADGPAELRPVGEVEFVNGVAAQSASGLYGELRAAAAIVGHADMTLGDRVRPVLEALIAAGNGRFKGIRHAAGWDADADLLGPLQSRQGLLAGSAFRAGFKLLAPMGLTFDAWVLEPQLDEVLQLARAFPDTTIVLDHCGTPLNVNGYRGKLGEYFGRWRAAIQALAQCPNVTVKLGGLAMSFCGMPEEGPEAGVSSEALAAMWRPYLETCIEAFGPDRAMFESNYPVDQWGASYATLWNTFKRVTSGASAEDKRALYAGTAARVYEIEQLMAGV